MEHNVWYKVQFCQNESFPTVYDMPMLDPDPPPLQFFLTWFTLISGMTKKSGKTAEFRVSAEKFKAWTNQQLMGADFCVTNINSHVWFESTQFVRILDN